MQKINSWVFRASLVSFIAFVFALQTDIDPSESVVSFLLLAGWPLLSIFLAIFDLKTSPLARMRRQPDWVAITGWFVIFYRVTLPVLFVLLLASVVLESRTSLPNSEEGIDFSADFIEFFQSLGSAPLLLNFFSFHVIALLTLSCVAPFYDRVSKQLKDVITGIGAEKNLSIFPNFDPNDVLGLRLSLLNAVPEKRLFAVLSMRDRAISLRRRASFLLVIMILLIATGVVISVFFAGNIVSGEASVDTRFSQVRSFSSETSADIQNLNEAVSRATEQKAVILSALASYGVSFSQISEETMLDLRPFKFKRTEINRSDETCEERSNNKTSEVKCSEIEAVSRSIAELAQVEAQLEGLLRQRHLKYGLLGRINNDLAENLVDYLPKDRMGVVEPNESILIASAVTRFGILFVVIYLVQIIVGIYRYSLKLASHYEFVSDSLILISPNSNSLGSWKDDIQADIRFGKDPKSPSVFASTLAERFVGGKREKGETTPIASD